MNKKIIALIIIIVILTVSLAIMTKLYLDMKKSSELGIESTIDSAEELVEANKKIDELENEIKSYKNNNITFVTNSTHTDKTNNTEYIPDGVKVADSEGDNGTKGKVSDMKFNRNPENVTIKVIEDTISNKSVQILITDNNEDKYGWGEVFEIQEKVNGVWKDLEYKDDNPVWNALAYNLDENNQLTMKVLIERYYGELDSGIYRVVKPVYEYDKEIVNKINIYSNEFEIK